MTETYTFSTALRMMRYGGKKMRPLGDTDDYWIIVENNKLVGCGKIDGNSILLNENNMASWFTPDDIMGSWIEVKE
jgi:hypothetical protein